MNASVASLAELYAPIRDELEAAQRIFDEELVSEQPFVNDLIDRVRLYRGKMLRPALLLLSAKTSGDITHAHPVLASVLEMVHLATLVHDDVLDEADERRRQPTVCSVSGNVSAVLLGDYLISHAFHLCSGLRDQHASRRIGSTTNRVCEGEMLQNREQGNGDLTDEQYFRIIRGKTGALTATACELGAHYAGAAEEDVAALAEFGMSVGVAFQMIDDVLDITGDSRETGKTPGRDLSLGKVTLPVIHCLRVATAETCNALRAAIEDEGPCDREAIRGWLDETGSVAYAVEAAARFVRSALTCLERFPPTDARSSITALAEFILARRF